MSRSGRTDIDCASSFEITTIRPGHGTASTAEPNFASYLIVALAAITFSISVKRRRSLCDLEPSLSSIQWTGAETIPELKRLPLR